MKKHLMAICIIFSICFGCSILFCAVPAEAKVVNLKYATWLPPVGATAKSRKEFIKRVEKMSNGEIKITEYTGGSLIKPREFVDATMGGVADITYGAHAEDRRFQLSTVVYLPLLGFPNTKVTHQVINDLWKKLPEVKAEYKGVHLLGTSHIPPNILHFRNKPFRLPGDIKGVKIGVAPGPEILIMKALGVVPVGTLPPDWYMAAERGAVEGVFTSWLVLNSHKLYEVLKSHLVVELGSPSFALIMNQKKFESLSDKHKQILTEESERHLAEVSQWSDDLKKEGRKVCQEKGHTIIDPTPEELEAWRKGVKPAWDQWIEQGESKGLPAKKVLDVTLKLIEHYKKQDSMQ